MRLFITRHGTTEWNIQKRLQGWMDSSLTQEGINRAKSLGDRLKDIKFDYIYSSPQNRALYTAELIRGNKKVEIRTHDALMEFGFGVWEGMELSQIENEYPNEYYTFLNNPKDYVPINGESLQDLFKRINKFLEEIVNLEAENILIVTHGVTIKAILAIIKGMTIDEFSKLQVYTGTALNICKVENGNIELYIEGDISHIDTEFFEESNI